jgi:hypothetical protein
MERQTGPAQLDLSKPSAPTVRLHTEIVATRVSTDVNLCPEHAVNQGILVDRLCEPFQIAIIIRVVSVKQSDVGTHT